MTHGEEPYVPPSQRPVVEGWRTLAGLMAVIAGALFAGAQIRHEADLASYEL